MSNTWSFYDLATGEFIGRSFTGPAAEVEVNTPSGAGAYAGDVPRWGFKVNLTTLELEASTLTAPVRVLTLDQAKNLAWESIKATRQNLLSGTFTHGGNVYDVDPVNIAGAAVDAREALTAGETSWSQAWVLSNNTVVTLTAEQMIALGRAAKAVVSNLWATSQYLRGQIEAATTVAEVEAISWPT